MVIYTQLVSADCKSVATSKEQWRATIDFHDMNLIIVPASACSWVGGFFPGQLCLFQGFCNLYQLCCNAIYCTCIPNWKLQEFTSTERYQWHSSANIKVIPLQLSSTWVGGLLRYVVPYTGAHLYSKWNDLSTPAVHNWYKHFFLHSWLSTLQ